jgi:hypothetical protein
LAGNNALPQPTLSNGEGLGYFTGERAPNSFLFSNSQTPYLPDTVSGPAVLGTVTEAMGYEGQSELDSLESTLPPNQFQLSIASETSPFIGFNELFLSDLSDQSFENLVITIDGVGTDTIVSLNPGESWTTLVPGGETQAQFSLTFDDGSSQAIDTTGLGADYIVGVTVPEPSSLFLLFGTTVVLGWRRSRTSLQNSSAIGRG